MPRRPVAAAIAWAANDSARQKSPICRQTAARLTAGRSNFTSVFIVARTTHVANVRDVSPIATAAAFCRYADQRGTGCARSRSNVLSSSSLAIEAAPRPSPNTSSTAGRKKANTWVLR